MATGTSPFAGLHLTHATIFVHINNSLPSARFLCAVKLCQGRSTLCYLRCHLTDCWGQEESDSKAYFRKFLKMPWFLLTHLQYFFLQSKSLTLSTSKAHTSGGVACGSCNCPRPQCAVTCDVSGHWSDPDAGTDYLRLVSASQRGRPGKSFIQTPRNQQADCAASDGFTS